MNETWWLEPNQLDDAQKQILLEHPETQLLVTGPPGSGKTNLLVLRANYVRSVAPRILLLTFTRTLSEFLKSGPNIGRGDQIRDDEIKTFMAWAKQLVRDHGGNLPEPAASFDADRVAIAETVWDMINAQNLGRLYDVIFVDEVQDFLEIELRIVRRLAIRINAAGDCCRNATTRSTERPIQTQQEKIADVHPSTLGGPAYPRLNPLNVRFIVIVRLGFKF
jgi:superfamily I DNA/RNA helicase